MLPTDEGDWVPWGPAWARHQDVGWPSTTQALATMLAIDGPHQGSCFRKVMRVMPQAMLPGEYDRGGVMSFIREPSEAGYMAGVLEYEAYAELGKFPEAPHEYFIRMAPPYLGYKGYEVPYALLTAARSFSTHEHRGGTPHFVGWHQVEYSACPGAAWGTHVDRPPVG